jgi:large subunit ribosomal protein L24
MKRIRTGDTVIVIAGKSKNHIGKVIKVVGEKVIVEGANLVTKHLKPNPKAEQPGGIITRESPVHVSNVALYNPATKKADKVGFKYLEKDGKKHKVRYFKSNDEVVDIV